MHDHVEREVEAAAWRTEERSSATRDLDRLAAAEALGVLAGEYRRAFDAFERSATELAPLVEAVVGSVRSGGRVHWVGAGSSGRLAALDAAELPPTFGVSPDLFETHLAGGAEAMTAAVEDAEDDAAAGAGAVAATGPRDVVIGVTASGRTPFVLAALAAARDAGAFTALIDCNRPDDADVDCHVTFNTGAEPIAGSTRMNAATVQKLALNAISTLAMVQVGRTYSNLMVCVQPNNSKLRLRLPRMLRDITGATDEEVADALDASGYRGGVALAMLLRGWSIERAERAVNSGLPLRAVLQEP